MLAFATEGANVICADRDIERGKKIEKIARDLGLPGQVLATRTDVTD